MTGGWIPRSGKRPTEADGDENGRVFVWHEFQGVMLMRWDRLMENRFYAYWTPIRPATDGRWIPVRERLPTAAEADVYGCVLVRDGNGNRVTGWRQPESDGGITDWQRLPAPPVGLRRADEWQSL